MSARDRTEQALAKIADPKGEGARACLTVYADAARAAADAADARAKAGISLGPLDGAIVSIKDLFDVAGEPTRAGSKILKDAPPAKADAPVVRRLRAAGAVIVAKTGMSEFAFSGVGMNPHYGTPGNPADRARVPGGSSSGAAVAAADHMCEIAIGTDTGGSTRIPGALCGIVGFKPSAWRVPTEGAFPLSYHARLDRPDRAHGRGLRQGRRRDGGRRLRAAQAAPVAGLRLGVPQGLLMTEWDNTVGTRFGAARKSLSDAGVRVTDEPMPLLDEMLAVNAKGGFAPAEAFSIHREHLAKRADEFDPNVRVRIERGGKVTAADYVDMSRRARAADPRDGRAGVRVRRAGCCRRRRSPRRPSPRCRTPARSTPRTCCCCAIPRPGISSTCARSRSPSRVRGLPVGLMLVARNGHDRRLFEIAAGIERLFAA